MGAPAQHPIKHCRGTLQCHCNKLTRRAGRSQPLDPCHFKRDDAGTMQPWRGRKSPTNIGAVAFSRAGGLGMREEIQVPGEGQEQGGNVIYEQASEEER